MASSIKEKNQNAKTSDDLKREQEMVVKEFTQKIKLCHMPSSSTEENQNGGTNDEEEALIKEFTQKINLNKMLSSTTEENQNAGISNKIYTTPSAPDQNASFLQSIREFSIPSAVHFFKRYCGIEEFTFTNEVETYIIKNDIYIRGPIQEVTIQKAPNNVLIMHGKLEFPDDSHMNFFPTECKNNTRISNMANVHTTLDGGSIYKVKEQTDNTFKIEHIEVEEKALSKIRNLYDTDMAFRKNIYLCANFIGFKHSYPQLCFEFIMVGI